MAKPWDSTFARLVDKKMTPDPKRVALDLNGDPIALDLTLYDVRETRTPTGRIIREPISASWDYSPESRLHDWRGLEEAHRRLIHHGSYPPGTIRIRKTLDGTIIVESDDDIDSYKGDPMYAPKPKFQNTQEGRQKERLYDKKSEITAKEANAWLASLPPVEPVW